MALSPLTAAADVYKEALGSYMAHTIRGVINHFLVHRIELHLRVVVDKGGIASAGNSGATSMLVTHPYCVLGANGAGGRVNRLKANIFIHKYANNHLARICIAHEIYHLLLELDGYLNSGRTQWSAIESNKGIEDECNQFAWELCRAHNTFHKDPNSRKMLLFPEHTFDQPLKTNSTHNIEQWPDGVAIDPTKPFHGNTHI